MNIYKRSYRGEINNKDRFYTVYTKDNVTGFFYEEYGTNHWYAPLVLYFNHKEIEVRRPAQQVSATEAADVVFNHLFEMVKSEYSGKTKENDKVTRNSSINIFNPIKEVEIEGKLYLVEWHSRAGYFNIRRCKKYGERKYTTRIWNHINDEYEYIGEM